MVEPAALLFSWHSGQPWSIASDVLYTLLVGPCGQVLTLMRLLFVLWIYHWQILGAQCISRLMGHLICLCRPVGVDGRVTFLIRFEVGGIGGFATF